MTTSSLSYFDVQQNLVPKQLEDQNQPRAERRNTIGATTENTTRSTNVSIENFTSVNSNATSVINMMDNVNGLNEHRKLDRSFSEPCDRTLNNNMDLNSPQKQPAVNSSRYKTELCRPFEESGYCKYADKCQFAHGAHELKQLQRHPKYKTELCRTFHSKGFCPYGPRCNFIHEDISKFNERNNHLTVHTTQQLPSRQYITHISPQDLSHSPPVQRPKSINFNSSYNGSMCSLSDCSPPSSVGSESPVFFGEDYNPLMNSCDTTMLNFDNSTNCVSCGDLTTDFLSMDLAPLNIQARLTKPEIELLALHLLLNVNIQGKNILAFDNTDCNSTKFTTAALSSPDSVSGQRVNSCGASSFGSSNSFSWCGSPMAVESGRNFRLPVFNHISQD